MVYFLLENFIENICLAKSCAAGVIVLFGMALDTSRLYFYYLRTALFKPYPTHYIYNWISITHSNRPQYTINRTRELLSCIITMLRILMWNNGHFLYWLI